MALGIHGSLKLDDGGSPPVHTEVASYCTNIDAAGTISEVDATPYQPGVSAPVKITEAGFDDNSFTLTVKYIAAAWAFFSAIKGAIGLNYTYCPRGEVVGEAKVTGLCDVLQVGLPKAGPEALLVFEVRLRCTSQTLGTYST